MNKHMKTLLGIGISSLILVGFSGCKKANSGDRAVVSNAATSEDKTAITTVVTGEVKPAGSDIVISEDKPAVSTVVTADKPKEAASQETAKDKPKEAAPEKRNPEITEKKLESENEIIKTSIKYPVITGLEDKNIEAKLNTMLENKALDFQKSIENEAKLGYDQYLKEKSFPFRKYEVQTEYTVTYNKNDILSIKALYYQYTGGAHGGANQVGYNIDLKTGEVMLLSQLFDKEFDYKTVVINEILNDMKQNYKGYFPDSEKTVKALDENRPYYIEDGNVVIYFGQYEIGPYAAGIIEFKIPVSKLKFKAGLEIK